MKTRKSKQKIIIAGKGALAASKGLLIYLQPWIRKKL